MTSELLSIETWDELKLCISPTHTLEVDTEIGCGWIKENDENKYYLSTHTFYSSTYKYSTELLQKCGFNVQLVSWG